MRRAVGTAALMLAVALLMAGCKGFWDQTSSGGGSGSTTETSGNFYVLNVATNQIAGYYVKAGKLTALSGSPYQAPQGSLSITVSPNNAFLYVGSAQGVFVYTIGSDGSIALGNSSTAISSDQAISLQVSPDNKWLIDVASGRPFVFAIPLNTSTGAAGSATEQFVSLPSSSVQQVVISPDASRVFAAMGSGGTASIPFNTGNANPFGSVSTIAVKNSAGGALSVAVDPNDALLYVGETAAVSGSNSGGLRVFTFADLKEITGSPFSTQGLAPYGILPISTGSYVYVVNRQVSGSSTGVIAGFTVSSSNSTFTLSALSSTFTVGTNPVALAEDNLGKFVFAVDFGGSPDLKGYVYDSTTAGNLDAVISSATGTDPVQASAIAAAH